MTNSSSPTRNQLLPSTDSGLLSRFLVEGRNNELNHQSALAAAQEEHKRVREAAIRVYELHELREEHQRILELERKEQERLRAEAAIVEEERRLRELKAKTVPKLPPEPVPEPPKKIEPTPVQQPEPTKAPEPKKQNPFETKQQPVTSTAVPQTNGFLGGQTKPAAGGLFASTAQADSASKLENRAAPTAQAAPAVQPPATRSPAPPTASAQKNALADRYLQIHKELKKLRQVLQAEAKVPGSPLKGKMGTYRREIRVSIGQLTGGKGANAQPVRTSQRR
jgi:nucleoporin GLE1